MMGVPLIDEPTNHLDMHGRALLANYLQEQPRGYIVVSHDRYFVERVATDVVRMG